MMVMKVLVVMVMMMMIPMKPSSMTVTMAMISPLRKEISPTDFCLAESFLYLCVFRPQRRWSLSAIPLLVLGFRGDDIREGALTEVSQGGQTTRWRGLGLARTMGCCGPLVAHLTLSFWLHPSSGQIGTSGYFPRVADLQKYGVLTVLFPAES
jgi:hypothetical protein